MYFILCWWAAYYWLYGRGLLAAKPDEIATLTAKEKCEQLWLIQYPYCYYSIHSMVKFKCQKINLKLLYETPCISAPRANEIYGHSYCLQCRSSGNTIRYICIHLSPQSCLTSSVNLSYNYLIPALPYTLLLLWPSSHTGAAPSQVHSCGWSVFKDFLHFQHLFHP